MYLNEITERFEDSEDEDEDEDKDEDEDEMNLYEITERFDNKSIRIFPIISTRILNSQNLEIISLACINLFETNSI